MLSKNEFEVLRCVMLTSENLSQRKLAAYTQLSLGSVNAALNSCCTMGLIKDMKITPQGIEALEPHRVDNAIIMAAGLSSRFAPISYERPKGLLTVKGEVLIERQIKQLLEAGITDITVVVGYKKEYFFYLEQKFGVSIVVNPEYAQRNNNSTLWQVRDKLANSFICSSDDYFVENPFERYVYKAYYAASFVAGPTEEWCMSIGSNDRIVDVSVGGCNAWVMLGHAYFDAAFSQHFVEILQAEYELPQTQDKLWEQLYAEHIKEFDMQARCYPDNLIYEFDSLDELRSFDPAFIENVDSDIFDNIASVLKCEKADITGFYPLKQGLTNLSCHFQVGDKEYVYRHPGVGTEKLIDRTSEKRALELARDLGLDSTFIYEDSARGWKISRFIPHARILDPSQESHLKRAMEMCHTLHQSDAKLDRNFDFVEEGLRYEALLREHGPIDVPGYEDLKNRVLRLKDHVDRDAYPLVLSHNDFFMLNFLLDEQDELNLIDWEYAGMSDPANDFGTFVVCCELDADQAKRCLDYYLGHPSTNKERRHFYASIVFAGWCWYIWSLEKEAEGENVGAWLYTYYRYAAGYIDDVLASYEEA